MAMFPEWKPGDPEKRDRADRVGWKPENPTPGGKYAAEKTGRQRSIPETEEPGKPGSPTRDRRKILRIAALAAACLLTGYGLIRLVGYALEGQASRRTSEELFRISQQARSGEPETDAPAEGQESRTVREGKPADSAEYPAAAASSGPTDVSETDRTDPPSGTGNLAAAGNSGVPAENGRIETGRAEPTLRIISNRFIQLRKKSRYIVGWLSMDGLEEPVVQRDNEFFLNHDAYGKRNGNGAIFLDENIRLASLPGTLYLYGHNMKNGNMFGRLKKYRESDYFYSHRILSFDSMYEEGKYAVFAVMEMNTSAGTALWYDLWSLEAKSGEEREKAIREMERRSLVSSALDVEAGDQLLMLVTCLDGETERLVVAARRLREGETEKNLLLRNTL